MADNRDTGRLTSPPRMAASAAKFEEVGTQAAAPRVAILDAIAFQQAVGIERKAARLHYLTRRWADALAPHPRVTMLSSLDASQTWGIATVAAEGIGAAALSQRLLDRYKIVTSAVVSQQRPGPLFDFQGVRVSPGIYTTPGEIDAFIAAMRQLLA